MKFNIQYTDHFLQNNSGLVLFSKLLNLINPEPFFENNNLSISANPDCFSDLDIIISCLGMMGLGFSHFENIDLLRNDPLFKKALHLKKVPSKESLRQRLDLLANQPNAVLDALNQWNFQLLQHLAKPQPITQSNLIPIDFDVTILDNTGSHKEGCKQSYHKNVKGFAPLMANFGTQGYLLNLQFRPGNAHSNCEGTLPFILNTINMARKIAPQNIFLARFDSGHDADENIVALSDIPNTFYLIKHQFRGRNVQAAKDNKIQFVLNNYSHKEVIDQHAVRYFAEQPFLAKIIDQNGMTIQKNCRRILSVVEISHDLNTGQPLLFPFRTVHMWRTNLPKELYNPMDVILIYRDRGTSEQYHSEFKTDLGIQRLPSGKFQTNNLFMTIAKIVFNFLRIIGHLALPLFQSNKTRIRIKTVLLKIIYCPARLMRKNKQWTIALPRSNPISFLFQHVLSAF